MSLSERYREDIVVLEPTATRLDADAARDFRRRLLERTATADGDIIVDLSRVEFVDSTALGALVAAYKRMAPAGRELVLCGVQPSVRIIVELTRLHRVFSVQPTEAMAVDFLRHRRAGDRDASLPRR
jgi:anti-sigma B factor antagonist